MITQRQKREIESTKQEWCSTFGGTELGYCQNEFEKGLLWIKEHNYPKETQYSKVFWDWWKITMIEVMKKSLEKKELQQTYLISIVPPPEIEKRILNKRKLCH